MPEGPESADSVGIELLTRLVGGTRTARDERLSLLAALLGAPSAGWSPGRVQALSPLPDEATDRAKAGLVRAGALRWSAERSRYLVPDEHRRALTALYLLMRPSAADERIGDLAGLVMLGGDARLALSGLIDLLEEDAIELESAAGLPVSEQVALARRLERHVHDAESVLDALEDRGADRRMTERALELVGRVAGGVAGLTQRLAQEGADRVPARGRRRSAAELRELIAAAPIADRAASCEGLAAVAPRGRWLPAPSALAAALCEVRRPGAHGTLPDPGEPSRAAFEPRGADALERLTVRLRRIGHRDPALADAIAECDGWADALVVHHGFVRLHESITRAGGKGIRSSAELVSGPAAGVRAVTDAHAHDWESAGVG